MKPHNSRPLRSYVIRMALLTKRRQVSITWMRCLVLVTLVSPCNVWHGAEDRGKLFRWGKNIKCGPYGSGGWTSAHTSPQHTTERRSGLNCELKQCMCELIIGGWKVKAVFLIRSYVSHKDSDSWWHHHAATAACTVCSPGSGQVPLTDSWYFISSVTSDRMGVAPDWCIVDEAAAVILKRWHLSSRVNLSQTLSTHTTVSLPVSLPRSARK